MEKKKHTAASNAKKGETKPRADKNKKPKKATPVANDGNTGIDPDDWKHTKPEKEEGGTKDKTIDDIVHEKLDFPEAENDDQYFDDENLNDLVADR